MEPEPRAPNKVLMLRRADFSRSYKVLFYIGFRIDVTKYHEHSNPLKTIIECPFRHCCRGRSFLTWYYDVTTIVLWRHANARYWYCDVIFVDCYCTRKLAQRRSSLVKNSLEYRHPATRYSRLSVWESNIMNVERHKAVHRTAGLPRQPGNVLLPGLVGNDNFISQHKCWFHRLFNTLLGSSNHAVCFLVPRAYVFLSLEFLFVTE